MDKSKLALLILPLVAFIGLPQAFALESDNSYFLDDSEFISILIDVDSNGNLLVDEDDLYNIIKSEQPESHLLKITVSQPGFEIYAFTFG